MSLGPDTPDVCHCDRSGPWDVLVTLGGYLGSDASISVTHVTCGQLMEWGGPEEVRAVGLPLRLSVVSTTDRGPDDMTWFELAPRNVGGAA